ncbi:TlpA family protein disulfide reductase [Nocardioides currus]|uniref:Thioredoxin n=1 Tax=Nocardioides currus TaxID=2133958 RepID=A0A2R7YYM5_9ACTN|nr:thioredoxin family protein [Nocardioides currus]PUA81487.1 thioredoxin [Nocardioides currus]
MTGIVILGVAVVVAVTFGVFRRATDGAFAAESESTTWTQVSAALPSASLGERATLVQFSSAFCAPCRTTRVVLADIAEQRDGVAHLEVDAEQHLELVRALDVRRTPTTLVLDASGHEVARAAGAPRRDQVLAVLPIGATP